MRAAGLLCLAWRGCSAANRAVPDELGYLLVMLKAALVDRPSDAVTALQALGDCSCLWYLPRPCVFHVEWLCGCLLTGATCPE